MAGARARRTRKPTSISLDVQSGMRRSDRNSEDVSAEASPRSHAKSRVVFTGDSAGSNLGLCPDHVRALSEARFH